MAGASLLTLLDDIAAVLDDVALMTKVAAKKTAGVLGDDLALNAQQVSGVRAERELPVVWAVAKGSFKNKLILVPAALLISAFVPWAVTPLLMFGGAFLCFEGFEKLAHKFLHSKADNQAQHEQRLHAVAAPDVDMLAFEKDKIKGAIRTDFILSAEIIAITLGTVALASFSKQVAVLSGIAVLMTAGVYGLVAGIVKLDDAGLYLNQREGDGLGGRLQRSIGRGILFTAPYMMKSLSILGTAAMFMVGGSILTHGVPAAQAWINQLTQSLAVSSGLLAALLPTLLNAIAGIIAGAVALMLVSLATRIWKALKPSKAQA
jgi:predicted DNA repair protein MutK